MANVKITELTALSAADSASTDVLPIVDVSADATKKLAISDLHRSVPDGTLSAPGIAFQSDLNSGLYRSGTDAIALVTNGAARILIDATGNVTIPNDLTVQGTTTCAFAAGTAAAPSITFVNDSDTGLYSPSANQVALATNGSERMRINNTGDALFFGNIRKDNASSSLIVSGGNSSASGANIVLNGQSGSPLNTIQFRYGSNESMRIDSSGRLGVGTSSPSSLLEIAGNNSGNDEDYVNVNNAFRFKEKDATLTNGQPTGAILWETSDSSDAGVHAYIACRGSSSGAGQLAFGTGFASSLDTRLFISSTGNVGIGTTSPDQKLHIYGNSGTTFVSVGDQTRSAPYGYFGADASAGKMSLVSRSTHPLTFQVETSEVGRFDTSGRLLVGTSTARLIGTGNFQIQAEGSGTLAGISTTRNDNNAAGSNIRFVKTRGTTAGSATVVQSGDNLGSIGYWGTDGTNAIEAASIQAVVEGTPGANDMPGRLVFSTTADGASFPTERMRVQADGNVRIGNASTLYPQTDNSISVGVSGNRWSAIWAANGTIQTSDERAKTEIADANLGADFIKSLRPISYKWIEGGKRDTGERDEENNYVYESVPGQRTHWGFIAQEVKQAVDDAGVDFGGWVLTDKNDPDSQQALRYDQFIAPLTKALQEALAKIETLEQRLSDAGIA